MAGQLHAELQVQTSNSEEKGLGTLSLTNRSGESCFLPAGWAPIGSGGPHEYTQIPARRTAYPGGGTTITRHPGTSAFAGMRWHTGTGCGTTTDLGVAWHSSPPWTVRAWCARSGPPTCERARTPPSPAQAPIRLLTNWAGDHAFVHRYVAARTGLPVPHADRPEYVPFEVHSRAALF